MKLINSAAYEDIADHIILTLEDMQDYMKNFKLLKKDAIIYCKTDFTPLLFQHLGFSGRSYKLITHHSDYPIDHLRFNSKPSCIKKWYAINPTYKHPDLIPIPLGTKTPVGRAYHETQYNIKWLEENLERLQNKNKIIDKVYCNWTDTNLYRNTIIKKLEEAGVPYVLERRLSFENYCENMSDYMFVISPPGNGLDNHRTWEALSVHSRPIVIADYIYDTWKGLPIIQVKDYTEVTELLLATQSALVSYKLANFEYWENIIK